MAKSYDLRREVQVAKMQALLDAVVALDGNTDEIEAKLQQIIDNTADNATETTLALIESATNQFTFTDGKLDVNASISADGLATEITLSDVLLQNKRIENLLLLLLEQQKESNKLLKKILRY